MVDLRRMLGIGYDAKAVVQEETGLRLISPNCFNPDKPFGISPDIIAGALGELPVSQRPRFFALYRNISDLNKSYEWFVRKGYSPIDINGFRQVVSRLGETFDTFEQFRLATKYSLKRPFGDW